MLLRLQPVGNRIAAMTTSNADALRNRPVPSAGNGAWTIVVPRDAPVDIETAGLTLRDTLAATGAGPFRLARDTTAGKGPEIVLGLNDPKTACSPLAHLDEQGFVIRAEDDRLYISGGGVAGVVNGVYAFLEDHIGCRWLTSTAAYIPNLKHLAVGPLNESASPAFAYREVFYRDAWHRDFALPNRLNGQGSECPPNMLRELHIGWGTWCHTFSLHVPPERYYDDHPEYFALVNGERVPDRQLCLTDESVLRIVVEDLEDRIAQQPEARYWSVSQNDCLGYCECERCSAIDEREGSHMGSLLSFVNRVAAHFPDRVISTLAYQYSRKPPRILRPADNVLITLCSIECDRSRPIPDSTEDTSFRDDLLAWAALTDDLFVWDYVVQFSNLVSPFPNLHVLGPNMRFFAEHRVKGIFSQGNRETGGEFAELRAFLLAKLSWDPYYDVERGTADFLTRYYGPAAEPIGTYVDTMHRALATSGAGLRVFGGPSDATASYLTADLIRAYERLFDEAEEACASDDTLLLRVRAARLPLQYASLRLEHGSAARRRAILRAFADTSRLTGMEKVEEWHCTVDQFVDEMTQRLVQGETG